MKFAARFVPLCAYRERPGAACRRPGWGNCARCGAWRQLDGGDKGFRPPRFCEACLQNMAEKNGGAK